MEKEKHKKRKNVIKQLVDVLENKVGESTIIKIEKSCYKLSRVKAVESYIPCKWSNVGFVAIYRAITFELICALNPNSDSYSPYALDKLIKGEITPEELGMMHPYELQPERKIEAEIIIKNSLGSGSNAIRASTSFKCACGHELTRTRNVYASRADEGVSKQVICLKCGNSWRE
jgi:DNA-directed RNA polymerase subunit M/transcription elongation factor TFIIS